jgi:hypothetical protein
MEAGINRPLLIPPSKWIGDMLRVGAEITIQFVTKVGFWRGGKCWQLIKEVFGRRRGVLKEKSASITRLNPKIRTLG